MNILKLINRLKWVVIFILGVFLLSLLYFSDLIINEIKEREFRSIERYSKFIELVGNAENESLYSFADIILIDNHSIPVIITSSNGEIIDYKNIEEKYLFDEYNSMQKKYDPIKINIFNDNGEISDFQYVYFDDSQILKTLIFAPYFIIILILIILFSIYLILYYSNKSEKDNLWTGLAKETAHQLGTPLSSLIGWNEYLRSKQNTHVDYVSNEIDKDISRLKIITERFSTIGSKPILEKKEIKDLILRSIEYLKKRTSPNIKTELKLDEEELLLNEQLFSWVIENLYKNSIDAIGESGVIRINSSKKNDVFILDFIDNGIGINRNDFKKIFKAGYTTKKRGWGLGLTLVNRIITDYHKGEIFVYKSKKNKETIIRIELKRNMNKS